MTMKMKNQSQKKSSKKSSALIYSSIFFVSTVMFFFFAGTLGISILSLTTFSANQTTDSVFITMNVTNTEPIVYNVSFGELQKNINFIEAKLASAWKEIASEADGVVYSELEED